MEGELGAAARIAIALIVIGVIISVIFVILGFTRTTTNQGINTVQNSMDSMSLQKFDDYDQQIISGTQVNSTLKLHNGEPIGIVVRTTKKLNSVGNDKKGFNYGAIFTGAVEVTSGSGIYHVKPERASDDDSYYTLDIETNSSGLMGFNNNVLNTRKSGTTEYIRPTAKFLGELIKDSTGTIVGMCFTQQ